MAAAAVTTRAAAAATLRALRINKEVICCL
jgi:hypothetical protein